jgi:hypothetical protein
LSGAAFGLFENLGNTSNGGTEWALLVGSRISTLLLHSFTTGLVGWALASAWTQRRFLRLAVSFSLAVLIHGLWNGLAVLSAAGSLQGLSTVSLPANLQQIGTLATVGILALGLLVLVLFFAFNSVLRHSVSAPLPAAPALGQISYNPVGPTQPPSSLERTSPLSDASDVPSTLTDLTSSTDANPPHLPPEEETPNTTETSE